MNKTLQNDHALELYIFLFDSVRKQYIFPKMFNYLFKVRKGHCYG